MITKTFLIKGAIPMRLVKAMADLSSTLNENKIGRHRRGTLLLQGFTGSYFGTHSEVKVTWSVVGQDHFIRAIRIIPSGGRQYVFRHRDHRRILSRLGRMSVK